ncbi:MAG: hypothetical protein RL693_178, partial [Verrucomicrobiota bacterium]
GLAVATLVCSILSYFTCFITGVAAIICGHLALSKIKKSGGAIGGRGMAIAGLIVTYLSIIPIIALMASIGLPAYKQGVERGMSMANARVIVLSCKNYASKHEGKFPDSLEVLVKEGAIKADSPSKFEYFGATMQNDAPSGTIVLISDWKEPDGKRVVARIDGSVTVESAPEEH